ncbi:MAG: hypothetical protein J7499_09385 [Sphingopyxis sp.]|nr:hypothetical protein [Sphingopyxis sp.]
MTSAIKLTPKLFLGWLVGLGLAVLAFSQAAASVGLAVESFRPLGGGFFSWRAGQMRLSIEMFESPDKANAKRAIAVGQSTLRLAPLTPRSLWLVGRGRELQADMPRARQAMRQAERVSRRDGAVELWLGADNLRRGLIAAGLRNFDIMLRGDREAAVSIMPRLSLIVLSPDGRRHLAPYIRGDNPWFLDLMHAAVKNLPRAAPLATLLIDRGKKAPDIPDVRPAYAALVERLVRERSYREALQLYPLLPGADPDSLHDISRASEGATGEGYPPFAWYFPDSNVQSGTAVAAAGGIGLDLFGSPGTVGVAASKLLDPQGATRFLWQIDDRMANVQAAANWRITCLMGKGSGVILESVNLLDEALPQQRAMSMGIPAGCGLLKIDMQIAGGIGRTPATIVVSGLKLSNAKSGR